MSLEDDAVGLFAIDGEDWRRQAACRRDVCLVHPQCFDQYSWNYRSVLAVKVCEGCPVRDLCAAWAAREQWSGVAAGELWRNGVPQSRTHGASGYARGCRCAQCLRRKDLGLRKLGFVDPEASDAA